MINLGKCGIGVDTGAGTGSGIHCGKLVAYAVRVSVYHARLTCQKIFTYKLMYKYYLRVK